MSLRSYDLRILILGATGLAAACGGAPERRLESAPEAPPRAVRTVAASELGAAASAVPGVVQARERATLVARLAAPIVALPYEEGDSVARGAVVARLDASALTSRVRAAEADARLAAADRDRYRTLVERAAATPREADGAQARADVAQAALTAAQADLAFAVVRAPFAGRVAARPANLGDVVVPGQPILELEGTGGLEVRATVAAELLPRLTPGTVVKVEVDGQPAPLDATVRVVAPAGDPATHRFEVRADLAEGAAVSTGLFARLVVGEAQSAASPSPAVPTSALFSRGGLTGLFVVSEGHARLRWVAVGAVQGALTEIRAGLRAGERVAIDPEGLLDGALVIEERGDA